MLTTPWTSLVSPTNALPDYPRPQLTRPDWLNLNGLWQFEFADSLASPPIGRNLGTTALVPYPVESALCGIQPHGANKPFMWYRRTVQIPPTWQGRRMHLHFGAVNWRTDVWVNGRFAGTHRGAYDAFSFDITDVLQNGDNEILVGVHSPLEAAGIPLGKQRRGPGHILYTASSGIWQTVWLEPTRAAHIVKLEPSPDVDGGKLDLIVRSVGFFAQDVKVVVLAGGVQVAQADGHPNEVIQIPIPNARLWQPEDPFLYDLRVTLGSLSGTDTVGSYFGMRSVSKGVVNGRLRPLLNGRFVFHMALLDQGFWPDGLYTAPTDEALKFDLEQQKKLGFNAVRKHAKVEPARWYYWADRLGLLVWQDMPSLPMFPPDPGVRPATIDRPNFETELHRMVDQLRGFTSIVMWVPFNESWRAYDRARIAGMVRSWDPTRLVNVDSGGLLDLPASTTLADLDQIGDPFIVGDCLDDHVYPSPTADLSEGGLMPRAATATRVAMLGECGAAAWPVPGHEWQPGFTGFITLPNAKVLNDSESLTAYYVERLEAIQKLVVPRGLSGAVYTQLTDVENERNGLWTYDRRFLKVDAERVLWANLTARTAAATDRSQQHVFYRGTDSAIAHLFWNAATEGLYVDSWTARTNAPAAAGRPAVMVWPKQQHIFYRGADGALNHIFWDEGKARLHHDRWTPNSQVPNAPAATGDPVTMVWPGQQHVFYRSAPGAINHIFWNASTNALHFDQWQPNPQVPNAPPAAGDPATMLWTDQQHVFYRSRDGAINHIFWHAPTNQLRFDPWRPNPQVPNAPPAAGDPVTMAWPNQQHVFYRGADGSINHIFWHAPTDTLHFDQWQPNSQVPNAPPAAGDPVTMVWPNQQHVFYRSQDGAINHLFWDASTNRLRFDQWQPSSQVPNAPPAAGDPATMVTARQQHVFYRSQDGAINHLFWDAPTNRLHFDQWTSKVHAPMAAGDPTTLFTP
jgi:hypothetical protein